MTCTIENWAGEVKRAEVSLDLRSTGFGSVRIEGAILVARKKLKAISRELLPYTISLDGVMCREKLVPRQPAQFVD